MNANYINTSAQTARNGDNYNTAHYGNKTKLLMKSVTNQ